ASIAERLKEGNAVIADHFGSGTVMFSDIVGFTALSQKVTPTELGNRLNRLFSAFDDLAERHGLEKIKTIGDAYMVVGGVPEVSADHPARVVAMGLDMLRTVEKIADETGRQLDLRVGVHTGPVVAGVIGTTKFSYDLW